MLFEVGEMGEIGDPLALIAGAEAFDDRFFRRKRAVEVAGAHAGGLGDILHRCGMEAAPREHPFGRFKYSLAPLVG